MLRLDKGANMVELTMVLNMLVTAFFGVIAFTFHKLVRDIQTLTNGVNLLNEKMAIVVTKIEQHDSDIKELKSKKRK